MLDSAKPDKINWRHYFGGFGFISLILQLITGLILIFYYDPSLSDAYKSIQYISNQLYIGGLTRNLHRWIPALMVIAIIVHTVRSFLRSDYRSPKKKVVWLTGVLLMLPIFLLIVTGLIVPWEWKGYWFMEMIPNYFEPIPYIGPTLKTFFMDSFTIPRYYVVHILFLPLISILLIDYHMFSKLRKRGLFRYILKQSIVTLPFIILLFVLAIKMQIPSNDPIDIPMPLDGEWVLAPEWYFLTFVLPFLYVKGIWIPVLAIGVPLLVFFFLAFLPYFVKSFSLDEGELEAVCYPREGKVCHPDDTTQCHLKEGTVCYMQVNEAPPRRWWHNLHNTPFKKRIVNGIFVTVITLTIIGLLFIGNKKSPTLGCNSCHNTSRGIRMGIVPAEFKDRSKLPHLNENDWMINHWYYPDITW